MNSTDAAVLVLKREADVDAAELRYSSEHTDPAWRAVSDARDAHARAELDLQLILTSEAAARAAEVEAIKAKHRAEFEAAAKDADLAAYLRDARRIVAEFAEAMKLAEAHLLELHARTEAQVAASRLAGRIGEGLGLHPPAEVSNSDRDLFAIVSLEAAGTARRIDALLVPPGLARLRATLDYGERGTQLRYAIEREASDRGISGHDLGIADMHVSALGPVDWKDPSLQARQLARTAMGLDGAKAAHS
ncbi:MAG TPA: hypothetical protein VF316_25455 [Polyangiaceae bacterium]